MKKELSFKTKNYSIIPSQSLSIGARNQIPDFTLSGDSQNKILVFPESFPVIVCHLGINANDSDESDGMI